MHYFFILFLPLRPHLLPIPRYSRLPAPPLPIPADSIIVSCLWAVLPNYIEYWAKCWQSNLVRFINKLIPYYFLPPLNDKLQFSQLSILLRQDLTRAGSAILNRTLSNYRKDTSRRSLSRGGRTLSLFLSIYSCSFRDLLLILRSPSSWSPSAWPLGCCCSLASQYFRLNFLWFCAPNSRAC